MCVEHLPLIRFALRNMGIAPAIRTIVCDEHELEHVVVQSLRHLVECPDVLIERGNGEHVRPVAEIARQFEIGCIVADRSGQPERVVVRVRRPLIT